jgi:hypothetical protein
VRLLVAGLALLLQSGYVTGAPAPDWLGLATLGGRDAIQLGDNCGGVAPGLNVIVDDAGELQIVDPLRVPQPGVCQVLNAVHVSDVPCATNPAGECDVAFSR